MVKKKSKTDQTLSGVGCLRNIVYNIKSQDLTGNLRKKSSLKRQL